MNKVFDEIRTDTDRKGYTENTVLPEVNTEIPRDVGKPLN